MVLVIIHYGGHFNSPTKRFHGYGRAHTKRALDYGFKVEPTVFLVWYPLLCQFSRLPRRGAVVYGAGVCLVRSGAAVDLVAAVSAAVVVAAAEAAGVFDAAAAAVAAAAAFVGSPETEKIIIKNVKVKWRPLCTWLYPVAS